MDVIVIARGGGSVEDLLPFSDEGVLRAVFAAGTPVVSAIGHEPDSPLLDLVADVRASTPTDAAKLVVPDVREELARVDHLRQRGRQLLAAWVTRELHALDTIRARPVLADPGRGLAERVHEVDALRERARRTVHHQLDRAGNDLGHQLARVRGLSPLATCAAATPWCRTTRATSSPASHRWSATRALRVRVADGRIAAVVTGTEKEEEQ